MTVGPQYLVPAMDVMKSSLKFLNFYEFEFTSMNIATEVIDICSVSYVSRILKGLLPVITRE